MRSKRDRAAAALDVPVLRRTAALPTWNGVLILNYHRVGTSDGQPWDRTLWSATAEGFDSHLAYLARNADVVGPPDLPELMRRRRGRYVMLTFDDGYRDNYDVAYPLLRSHGLRATFFLTAGFLDRRRAAWWDEIAWMVRHAVDAPEHPDAAIAALVRHYKSLPPDRTEAFLDDVGAATGAGRCPPRLAAGQWMTWEMAREMRAAGMWLGGHSLTHPVLATLPRHDQEAEIAGCAARLESETGERMQWFAYPVGHRKGFTHATGEILTRCGVRLAFSFYGGYQRFTSFDPMDVPRIHIGPQCDERMLRAMLTFPQVFAREDA